MWGGLWTAIGCVCLWMLGSWASRVATDVLLAGAANAVRHGVARRSHHRQVVHERRRAETEQRRRQRAHRFIVESLTSLTEARDVDTGRHVRRTRALRVVANELAKSPRFRGTLTPETIELMAISAPLHDIGKVGIPDAVLNKPGPLTSDEYRECGHIRTWDTTPSSTPKRRR